MPSVLLTRCVSSTHYDSGHDDLGARCAIIPVSQCHGIVF
jgi:hypothetical protein